MWTQATNPLGNAYLSALAAAIPIVFLFWALAVKRMKGHVAGSCTAVVAVYGETGSSDGSRKRDGLCGPVRRSRVP